MSHIIDRGWPAVALVAAVQLAPLFASAGESRRTIVVLDAPDDAVDGPGFAEILDAYLAPIDARSLVVAVLRSPRGHPEWVAVAEAEGQARGALAVLWFEPDAGEAATVNVYLVLLDRDSGGVVVLPVALGARQGRFAYRVLAATARMILDTEVLEGLRKSALIQQRETTPEPWPGPVAANPYEPRPEPEPARTVDLEAGYLGDFRTGDARTLHGPRLGLTLGLARGFGIVIDVGYLTRPEDRAFDVLYREQRVPLRLGAALQRPVGRFDLAVRATWLAEPVWIRGETAGAGTPPIEATPRLDTGGGAELRARYRLVRGLGVFAGAGVTLMAVSHRYERSGEPVFQAGLVRLSWTAGLDWAGL